MHRIITLLTDFGLSDTYVGVMKGVILSINPDARIVDLTHAVAPQRITEAAFLLATSFSYFPIGTIHVVVVDPGVGSTRRPIAIEHHGRYFVGPDNGVLSSAVIGQSAQEAQVVDDATLNESRALPIGARAVELTNPRYWLGAPSHTFHGRDIFAPVAAHLSLGVDLGEIGQPIDRIETVTLPRPRRDPGGVMLGYVIHIDHFGNVVTNVRAEDLPSENVTVEIAGHRIPGLSSSYAEGPDLLAIVGSSGYVEIAERNSSAEGRLGLQIGDVVRFVPRQHADR